MAEKIHPKCFSIGTSAKQREVVIDVRCPVSGYSAQIIYLTVTNAQMGWFPRFRVQNDLGYWVEVKTVFRHPSVRQSSFDEDRRSKERAYIIIDHKNEKVQRSKEPLYPVGFSNLEYVLRTNRKEGAGIIITREQLEGMTLADGVVAVAAGMALNSGDFVNVYRGLVEQRELRKILKGVEDKCRNMIKQEFGDKIF